MSMNRLTMEMYGQGVQWGGPKDLTLDTPSLIVNSVLKSCHLRTPNVTWFLARS